MLINKSNLEAVFLNLKTIFNKAFDAAPSVWQATTMLVPSGSSQNNYNWLSKFPRMRKWIGDKTVKALEAFKYAIVNDDWEATVEVDRNDIEDDTLGIYAPMAQSAGFSAKQLPDEIDADLKNNAFASECYDGQYFYDTDHPVAGASVSNKGTAVLSNATTAAATAGYGAARTAIMKFQDEDGRPLALVPDTLEVPPALETIGRMLLENEKLAGRQAEPVPGHSQAIGKSTAQIRYRLVPARNHHAGQNHSSIKSARSRFSYSRSTRMRTMCSCAKNSSTGPRRGRLADMGFGR